MKITKNRGLFLAQVLILIVVYNVIVFVIPVRWGGWFFTGYGFTMISILMAAAVIFYTFNKEGLKSKVYGVPLTLLAMLYFALQFVLGLIEIVLQAALVNDRLIPFQFAFALNTLLLGAFLIGLISAKMGTDVIERIDAAVKEKVFYIKSLQADVEGLVSKAQDDSAKKALKDLAETIRYSDPMSSPQLATIENKIEAKVDALVEGAEKSDWNAVKALCAELQELFADRNRKCKALK